MAWWLQWFFQAKRRYGLTILNYMVTSNHIHLILVADEGMESQAFA
jgi:putative transposase